MRRTYTVHAKATYNDTLEELAASFGKWGVREWTVIPTRPAKPKVYTSRGLRGEYWDPSDMPVSLMFRHPSGRDVHLRMASQERPQDNLRVLYLAVEAMRMNETRGISETLRAAYLQLEAPVGPDDPYRTLGVRPDAPMEDIEAVYRSKAKRAHPDAGGSADEMKRLNAAIEKIREQRTS